MTPEELLARECIRDLVARYNSLGDRGRIDEMLPLFTEDATLEVPDEAPLKGRQAIATFFRSVATPEPGVEPPRKLRHHLATHIITLQDADSGRGQCYFSVYTQDGLDHWGCYTDRYTRTAQGWQFQTRKVSLDGVIAGGWADRRKA